MKIYVILAVTVSVIASSVFADGLAFKAVNVPSTIQSELNQVDSTIRKVEISGEIAKQMYLELTEPSRSDSLDIEGGREQFISVGKNIACSYITNPDTYLCKIEISKVNGAVIEQK